MQVQEQTEAVKISEAPKSMRRKAATKLWVHFEHDGEKGIIGFDFKSDLDMWLRETNAQILTIIRGVEKKFETKTRITL